MVPHRVALLSILAFLLTALAGCGGRHERGGEGAGSDPAAAGGGAGGRGAVLSIKGSDTMVILAQRWAEGYMAAHPGSTVQVSGGGSGTGIAALLNGTTDIATASRPMNERERGQLQTGGHPAHETRVALDALAVYVHSSSPVRSLTLDQLSRIFRGQITNWSEVGGPDHTIVLYSRENNSGTYAYFKEHVLDGADFAANAQTLPGTAAVINAISHDEFGIGYGGIGYGQGINTLSIAAEAGQEPIAPTMENATSGRYPIARFLYMYTAGEPSGITAELLAFATSAEGQRLVEAVGFYPLPTTAAVEAPQGATAPEAAAVPEGATAPEATAAGGSQ